MTREELFAKAVQSSQRGNLAEAARLCRQILAGYPGSFPANQLLGALCFQEGRKAEALELFAAALRARPDSAEILLNIGVVLKDLGRQVEALDYFTRALAVRPDFALALNHRGSLYNAMHRRDEALADFDKAIATAPFDAEAWNNRGGVLQSLHRLDEAIAAYEKALAYDPAHPGALMNLGSALLISDRVEEGLAAYTRHARRTYGGPRRPEEPGPPHKARHDREQREYLANQGVTAAFHLEEGARLSGPAVNPANADAISEGWRTSRPQLVVIDDFLTPEALAQLRRFCWGSTVWRRSYNEGYLGALLEYGFACPVIGQIAEELRQVFPVILGQLPLLYLWGFKYDSRLSGVKIHADSAAVNVNFWITADEANQEPESGGLIVWDKAAPADWEFERYNANEKAMRDFLEREGAKPVTVPYRANRAVVFDSDLFHQTDVIRFKDGYLNRRINVTLLYGWRGGKI